MQAGQLGFIDTPAQGNRRPDGVAWCADNGCFGKGYPGDRGWFGWLAKNARQSKTCLFATAPDVVGDGPATLTRSLPLMPLIRGLGYPAALVAQNGLEFLPIPWVQFDVLFIGGTVECATHGSTLSPIKTGSGGHQRFFCPICNAEMFEWKLSEVTRSLVADAKLHGKWVHMGRVNSRKRIRYAAEIGCDSVDGTYLIKGPRENLPKLLRWLGELDPSR